MRPQTFAMLAALAACAGDPDPLVSTVESYETANLEAFNLQARIYCPLGTFCGHPDEASLIDAYYRSINEMNLEYIPSGYSFRALPPIITYDNVFSSTTGPGDPLIVPLTMLASSQPDRITLFLMPNLSKCWNGVPCPGTDDGFDGDDVIFCTPPEVTTPANSGTTYAHEMGHYWCLRHTHANDGSACDTLSNVPDTPVDPGGGTASDAGDLEEWCEASPASTDVGSPHATSCTVDCYIKVGSQVIATNREPLTENAMSYYGAACRGPYDRGGDRHEAFTDGQVAQIQECRWVVPVRTQLANACVDDSDHDGLCDSEDLCPQQLDARNADSDSDGRGDVCDQCPLDSGAWVGNNDGDAWCNVNDGCPNTPDTSTSDPDGDGLWASCDLCPNHWDPTNANIDGDAKGDVCDTDDDNDGCLDVVDQHPKTDLVRVGTVIHVNCNPSSSPILASEAGDTDGDGLVDCQDADDDNDGLPDQTDFCPTTTSSFCFTNGASCPLNPIFFTCKNGGCNELLLAVVEAVNPDPTRILFEIDFVEADHLTVSPARGYTLAESVAAISGRLRSGPQGPALRLELVDTKGNVVADLATYDARTVETSNGTGAQMEIALPTATSPVTVRVVR